MALFKVTVKRTVQIGGIRIEKGMTVEIPTTGYNPLTSNGGQDVAMAFLRIYGLDLKRAGACHPGFLDVIKIR